MLYIFTPVTLYIFVPKLLTTHPMHHKRHYVFSLSICVHAYICARAEAFSNLLAIDFLLDLLASDVYNVFTITTVLFL